MSEEIKEKISKESRTPEELLQIKYSQNAYALGDQIYRKHCFDIEHKTKVDNLINAMEATNAEMAKLIEEKTKAPKAVEAELVH